jgi:protein-arginine kinase activator protein McsA
MNCKMCGKETSILIGRWYRADNGEQFKCGVCRKCAELHSELLNVGGK